MTIPANRHNIVIWGEKKKIAGTEKALHYFSCSSCRYSKAFDSKNARAKAILAHKETTPPSLRGQ